MTPCGARACTGCRVCGCPSLGIPAAEPEWIETGVVSPEGVREFVHNPASPGGRRREDGKWVKDNE